MGKRYRWGILGTAEIALEIIKGIQLGDCGELQAIASRDIDKANDWACIHGIPLAYGSYEDLLRSDEVDMVYIPLPNSLHAQWTIKALEAGHCVLCEKPISTSAAEAEAVAAAAKRSGMHVAEAFMYRFHPQWIRILELIQSGAIGDVSTLHSQFTFLLDDPAANPFSAKLGGGALMDVGCYCVDFLRMIAGCEPVRVSALERRKDVDETMLGLLEFPGGVLASFETSIANYERHRAEIAGTQGSILMQNPWIPGDEAATIIVHRDGQAPETIIVPPANSYQLEVEEFVAVSNGEAKPARSVADAVANMKVIDALFRSARENVAIKIGG
jgi:D-xylose 1-dehydrogenase (NADP+, D-xylono-1,5-lactone-forming)